MCGLNENVSIAIIGKLKDEELSLLKGIDFQFHDGGWPSDLDEKDQLLNEKFPVDLEEAVKEDGFVLFGGINKYGDKATAKEDFANFYRIFDSRFPIMAGLMFNFLIFRKGCSHLPFFK